MVAPSREDLDAFHSHYCKYLSRREIKLDSNLAAVPITDMLRRTVSTILQAVTRSLSHFEPLSLRGSLFCSGAGTAVALQRAMNSQ